MAGVLSKLIFAANVDPRFERGAPSPDEVRALGLTGVALVSRRDTHDYAWTMRQAGIHVLARIDKSSEGWMVPASVYQIGNEPDIESPASWTMTTADWIKLWNQYRNTYPSLVMIGPGLASGDVSWWKKVSNQISGCAGVGVHPYAKSAAGALELLRAYANITPKRKLWISEWNRPADEVAVFAGMLGGVCEYAAWFCWTDLMVDRMGLLDSDGEANPEGVSLTQALRAWGEP